jgi:LysM repeat protein
MQRILFVLLLLALATMACSLGSTTIIDDNVPTLVVVQPTDTPVRATSTPQPTVTPLPSNTPVSGGNSGPIVCGIRTDWPYTYVVARGDTLSSIARRGSTTFQILAQGNCLPNANAIEVGQVLRVPYPVAPPSPTPPPTITPQPDGGPIGDGYVDALCADNSRPDDGYYVMVVPRLHYDNGCVTVADRDTLTITWPTVPNGVTQVIYLLRYPNTMNPIEIGRSTDWANKFPITVNANTLPSRGILYAWIGAQGGENMHSSDHLGLKVESIPQTACGDITEPLGGPYAVTITPHVLYNNGCYNIQANTPLTISWSGPTQGVAGVTFYRMNTRLSSPDVIGVDHDPTDGWWITWTAHQTMPPSTIYVIADGPAPASAPVGVVVGQ